MTYDLSAFSDSACRARSFASTAGNTNISVDVVLCITLGNSSYRATVSACSARNASIRNYICHSKLSSYSISDLIISQKTEVNK